MVRQPRYALEPPATDAEWAAYHDIRRKVLFESRGHIGVYDAQHPDEHRPGNHPLLLTHDGVPVAVIRVDLARGRAIFRRVAVRDDLQRRGHGRVLLGLAEAFVRAAGGTFIQIQSYVDPEAVAFYERCGFVRHDARDAGVNAVESSVLMIKDVRGPSSE
jgi:GNAT superfamily N-acetyltransferase